jgi:hypothetical protein
MRVVSEQNINAAILKFLRNRNGPATVYDVVQHVGRGETADLRRIYMPSWGRSARNAILIQLEKLHAIGLVILGSARFLSFLSPSTRDFDRRVRISPNFVEIQRALGISLTEAETRQPNTMAITPVFNAPLSHDVDIFVMMPFAKEFDGIFSMIAECCRAFDLKAVRADDLFKPTHIIQDIWSLTVLAKAVICDCTGKNPNVFYELGIAHTLGKDVVLLTQKESDIPFDLRHWRYLVYDPDTDKLKSDLRSYLSSLFAKPEQKEP